MSLMRAIYNDMVSPVIFEQFSDDRTEFVYRVGGVDVVSNIEGILRNQRIVMVEDSHGDYIRKTVAEIVISSDPNSPWGGVAEPQLMAEFVVRPDPTITCSWETLGGEQVQTLGEESLYFNCDEDAVTWRIEPFEGEAIKALSDSFVVASVVRHQLVGKSRQGYRVRT